jgi:hypothetical protein
MLAGVTMNIPPFLNHERFAESDIHVTKDIAWNRIHDERRTKQ